ncbi:tetratricopeptide repeat protein [Alteromonas facilis]|uniref:tetratricopeptide repeat protein n=1 Tax=Alteromonas facilis TaxID=2048004 RepID=UPI000C294AAF|nr:tetratricopeptide repeat protein [Alteromonas facilis]
MSVVNKMLKDLEQRNAESEGHSAVYQAPHNKKKSTIPLLLAIIVVLIVALLLVAFWPSSSSKQVASPPVTETANAAQAESQIEQPAAKPMLVKTAAEKTPDITPSAQEPAAAAEPNNTLTVDESESAAIAADDDVQLPQESQDIEAAMQAVDTEQASPETTSVFKKQATAQAKTEHSLRERALAAVRSGQDELAISLLRQLVTEEPENIAARKKLAAILFAKGDTLKAQSVLENGIQQHPTDNDMRLMLARLLEQQQQLPQAFSVVSPDNLIGDVDTDLIGFRAALAERLQHGEVAYQDYLTLTQRDPAQARWWLGLAIASERQGQTTQAIDAYRQAVALRQLGPDVGRFIQQRLAVLVGSS